MEVTIAGGNFKVPSPFAEGHVLTKTEAQALNQTFRENIRNNSAKKVKELLEKKTETAKIQKVVDEYVGKYEFGVSGGGGRVMDPVEREAINLATNRVKAAIRKKGLTVSDFTSTKLRELAKGTIKKYPDIMAQAKTVVAAREKAAAAASTDIDIEIEAPVAEEAAAV